MLQRRKRDGLV